jgi:hypothetical protein
MDEQNRPNWETLPETTRTEWIREASNFYAPGTVSETDIVEMARENYSQAEALFPIGEE